ncbi:MAG: FtsW/RodA/SpoVE family cell cycle protein, partial [candidate division WOR-3 bacterium]|nr:FtsW/RodA/SpoVE family cell cycle protein [candidate division WOR-3 bacterium]
MRPKLDWLIIIAVSVLTIIGLVVIYSAGGTYFLLRQIIWVPIAVIGLILAYNVPQRLLYYVAYPLFIFSLVLLLLLLAFGSGVGAKRWFDFGIISFQPSEFAKIGLVLVMAR